MRNLNAGYLWLLNALRVLAGLVIFAVFALIVTDVLVRFAGLSPWSYTSGIVEYGLLWFTMLAAPWLVRIRGHVFIDAITQILPAKIQRVLAKVSYFICVCASATLAYFSFELFLTAFLSGEVDIRGEDMPLWSLYLPMPIGLALVAVEFARYLVGFDDMYGDRTDLRDAV